MLTLTRSLVMSLSLMLLPAAACQTACAHRGDRAGVTPDPKEPPDKAAMTHRLAAWLSGKFTSAELAERDADYRDVSLIITPIWTDRPGCWLYVEQALAESPDKPYRQRVYRLSPLPLDPGEPMRFRSDVFALPGNPLAFAGSWRHTADFSRLRPEDLTLRDGCTVIISQVSDGEYTGATSGNACASDLNGAAYATTEVRITRQGIDSWDRGFDAQGRQVWGPTKGPYVFLRTSRN